VLSVEPVVAHAQTDEEIAATFEVMRQLRPELAADRYVAHVRSLMDSEGLRLLAVVDEGTVRGVAAYRFMQMLYCGRLLYLDDLVVDERVRSRGYGAPPARTPQGRGPCAWLQRDPVDLPRHPRTGAPLLLSRGFRNRVLPLPHAAGLTEASPVLPRRPACAPSTPYRPPPR
jgi:hypothetical protein